jgi:hypothetical protein
LAPTEFRSAGGAVQASLCHALAEPGDEAGSHVEKKAQPEYGRNHVEFFGRLIDEFCLADQS